jgi:hypothetical protein
VATFTYLRAKRRGHSLHSYGLSPVCARRCRPTCCGRVKVAEQSLRRVSEVATARGMSACECEGNKTRLPGISTTVDGVASTYGTLVITSHPGNESAWMFACSLVSF